MNSKSLYSKLALLGGALFRPFFLKLFWSYILGHVLVNLT
jgi:hypothetical protein